jgi:type VI secretion system protein ImpF
VRADRGGESLNLADLPMVASSVVNYGLPDLAGRTVASLDITEMENLLRQAIWDFEPRVIRETVSVRAIPAEDALNHHNTLVFLIQGQLWGQRISESLFLRTEIDLEIGEVRLTDQS